MDHVKKIHYGYLRHICGLCDKTFKTVSQRNNHRLKEHPVENVNGSDFCKICSKRFKYLDDHMARVHGTDNLPCSKCGRVFKHQRALDKHNCKPCVHCGKIFLSRQLKQHIMRVHVPEDAKPYKCFVCETDQWGWTLLCECASRRAKTPEP